MKATTEWLEAQEPIHALGWPRAGCAILPGYNAGYLEWGSGQPLILIPGLAGGVNLVAPLAASLARRFRVVSYQLRGEEDCFALRRGFGLTEMVEDLAHLIGLLGLENPMIVGVSFGGVIALEFAARYRFRLSGLAVQGVDVRFKKTLLRQIAGQVLRDYPLPTDSPFVNQFFNLLFGGRLPEGAGISPDRVARHCWQTDQGVMAHRFRMAEQFDLSDKLQQIAAPTLLLSGAKDVLVSKEGLKVFAARIADVSVRVLPEAGHLAFVTHAPDIATYIGEFAKEVRIIQGR